MNPGETSSCVRFSSLCSRLFSGRASSRVSLFAGGLLSSRLSLVSLIFFLLSSHPCIQTSILIHIRILYLLPLQLVRPTSRPHKRLRPNRQPSGHPLRRQPQRLVRRLRRTTQPRHPRARTPSVPAISHRHLDFCRSRLVRGGRRCRFALAGSSRRHGHDGVWVYRVVDYWRG